MSNRRTTEACFTTNEPSTVRFTPLLRSVSGRWLSNSMKAARFDGSTRMAGRFALHARRHDSSLVCLHPPRGLISLTCPPRSWLDFRLSVTLRKRSLKYRIEIRNIEIVNSETEVLQFRSQSVTLSCWIPRKGITAYTFEGSKVTVVKTFR